MDMGKAELQASLNALDIWLIGFGIIVAISTVGASVAGYLHFRRSSQLQTILEAENLAQANWPKRMSALKSFDS
jgi:hypothetical protein